VLTATIGWRALMDRPAAGGEALAAEADADAGPAETTAVTAPVALADSGALADTGALAEPPFADMA
jgi:hypothetical protein